MAVIHTPVLYNRAGRSLYPNGCLSARQAAGSLCALYFLCSLQIKVAHLYEWGKPVSHPFPSYREAFINCNITLHTLPSCSSSAQQTNQLYQNDIYIPLQIQKNAYIDSGTRMSSLSIFTLRPIRGEAQKRLSFAHTPDSSL